MAIAPAQKPGLVFVARFLALLVVFYLVIAFNPVNDHVIVPFTELIAQGSAILLRALNQPIEVSGTVMRYSQFGFDVKNGCNGIEAMMILAAAILAFPATLRSRLTGLLVAIVSIQLFNLVRISSLVWLGVHHRELFDLFHVAVWQTIIILVAVSMFVLWSWKFAEKPVTARP